MRVDILDLPAPKADARVAYGTDGNQFIDLRLPTGKSGHPVAICVHGGYWRATYNLEYLGHLCAALTARGVATANLEYRRVGNAGGGWPVTFEDIRAAYQFLVQHGDRYRLDPQRVAVLGHSAGGQLALCLAGHEHGLMAAISLAGVVDLQRAFDLHLSNEAVVEFLGGTPAEVPDHYREADPMKLAIRPHQWVIYGNADEHVPQELSKVYITAKSKLGEDVRPVEIAGAGHFDLVDPRTQAGKRVVDVALEAVGLGKG